MCEHCPTPADRGGFCDDLIPERPEPTWFGDPGRNPDVLLTERADAGYYDPEDGDR
jgi:hypothetical protein